MNQVEVFLEDGEAVTRLENDWLRVDVAPGIGGRITRIYHKGLGAEFLWRNRGLALQRSNPGAAYDPVFYGGIDEVIPGDMPETIDGLACPDHGELWTLPLEYRAIEAPRNRNSGGEKDGLELWGRLPRWGLGYHKQARLRPDCAALDLDYRITNESGQPRVFLWKLHAAAAIAPGDRITCPAGLAVAADPQWARYKSERPFAWPTAEGMRADVIPPPDGSTDFLFLYALEQGRVSLQRAALKAALSIDFDPAVFPYVCYFASYGGLDGHYTAVLEPCTAMPVSVNEAARLGQCSRLAPGEAISTRVSISIQVE